MWFWLSAVNGLRSPFWYRSPQPQAGQPGPSGPAHSPSSSAAVAAAAWCPRVERHSLVGDGLRHRVVGQELHLDRVLGQRAGGDRTYGLAFTRPVPGDACRTLLPRSAPMAVM